MKVFVILISFLFIFPVCAGAFLSEGSCGEEVYRLQSALCDKGFYFKEPDGVYGRETADAVCELQRSYGVYPDGVYTEASAKALGIPYVSGPVSDGDVIMLARFLSKVCSGCDGFTMSCAASVIVNRTLSPAFPDTAEEVVLCCGGAGCCDLTQDCLRASYEALIGAKPCGGALYFERSDLPCPVPQERIVLKHGGFIFYY